MTKTPSRGTWVIAGGGTGGHVTPALAIAEHLTEQGEEVLILGSEHGLETRLVPDAGFELVALPSRQLMGQGALQRLASIAGLIPASYRAWKLLGRRNAVMVISVGGYASVPAVLAAAARRVPVTVLEPNAIPGRANRLAARIARRVFVQFEQAAKAFDESGARSRAIDSGIPLRGNLLRSFRDPTQRRRFSAPLRLLVFGGSQGARQINEAMMTAAEQLDGASLEIVHQTGEADRERVAQAYEKNGIQAEVVAFEPDMPRRYAWADLGLCRSGALTVAELALAGLPALLVPYPFAADDHQAANASSLAKSGAAWVLDPKTLDGELLVRELERLSGDPGAAETLHSMSTSALALARPNATEDLVNECASLLRADGRET
ncbi:undecaprenyldiphospho-muramoylpentapeptide beta-N-acetylglucosaminyltransferase [Myxococcota bacterium]|nr:undecaprenyldiphospho-muramoylpentapeptide beta-N-acetylglucosaminyltransferase [Myxococcota bacterium]